MEAGLGGVALSQHLLGLLEEVHEGRVGLEQVRRVLEHHVAHALVLRPVGGHPAQLVQHAQMRLVDGRQVTKNYFQLGVVQQGLLLRHLF